MRSKNAIDIPKVSWEKNGHTAQLSSIHHLTQVPRKSEDVGQLLPIHIIILVTNQVSAITLNHILRTITRCNNLNINNLLYIIMATTYPTGDLLLSITIDSCRHALLHGRLPSLVLSLYAAQMKR